MSRLFYFSSVVVSVCSVLLCEMDFKNPYTESHREDTEFHGEEKIINVNKISKRLFFAFLANYLTIFA